MSPNPIRAVQIFAPAKLNLFLELLDRRADGYHQLESIMIAVNRFDCVHITVGEAPEVQVACRWLPGGPALARRYGSEQVVALPAASDNLVTRSLQRFRARFAIEAGFQVSIDKSIPAGAGMGGASSDAAAALQGAADLCGLDRHDPALLALAGEMGSDIPFFFGSREGPMTAGLATGRGEQIEPIRCGDRLHFVVVHPPVSISTAQVYKNCQVARRPRPAAAMVDALSAGCSGLIADKFLNRLAKPAGAASGWIDRVLTAIGRTPVLGHQMTGSGSACFGICRTALTAAKIARGLQAAGIGNAFTAQTVCVPGKTLALS